jgi:hypothetical protein
MSCCTDESDIAVVRFSQPEGRQLFAFLEHAIALADPRLDPVALIAAIDSLGDANALAHWQREYVALDVSPREAAAVVQALELAPECCEKCASLAADLTAVRAKLASCLASGSAMADKPSVLPPLTRLASSPFPEPLAAS